MMDIFDLDDDDEEEDEENWLASYSDLMSDLLAVFIMLYAFALLTQGLAMIAINAENTVSISQETLQNVSIFDQGMDVLGNNNKTSDAKADAESEGDKTEEKDAYYSAIVDSIQTYVIDQGLSDSVEVLATDDNTITIRADDTLFFASGSSDLASDSPEIIAGILDVLRQHIGYIDLIRVEGHTDNQPISNERFASNWELSVDRAVKVLKELIDLGAVDIEKLAAVGYAEYRPIADNATPEGRSQNRRVDFVITVADPVQ